MGLVPGVGLTLVGHGLVLRNDPTGNEVLVWIPTDREMSYYLVCDAKVNSVV